MDDDSNVPKIDLAGLMPLPERLEAMASAIVTRVKARRVRLRDALSNQIVRWAAPALGIAASLAVCLWMVGASPADTNETETLVSQWALNNEVPATNSILEALDEHPTESTR